MLPLEIFSHYFLDITRNNPVPRISYKREFKIILIFLEIEIFGLSIM